MGRAPRPAWPQLSLSYDRRVFLREQERAGALEQVVQLLAQAGLAP